MYSVDQVYEHQKQRITELEAENQRLKSLLRTARGSSFRWPEQFKAAVDAALQEKGDGD